MADGIQATPRNPFLGLLSDFTQGGIDYLRDPRFRQAMMQLPAPVRPFGMGAVALPGLLESTGLPKTLERSAYGEDLTNISRANVPMLKPETADALMTLAPLAPAALRGAAATGRFVAPKAGQLAEQYMVRTGGILPLDVYHGTPHRLPPTPRNPLGEFDASKIGTGEGAQSYGHGIYTAENPAVSMKYQPRDIKFESNITRRYSAAEKQQNYPAMQVYEDFASNKRPEEILSYIQEAGYSPKDLKTALNAHKIASKEYANQKSSFLYKADLPDEKIAQMIDYDKPMAEQRNVIEKMRKALVGPDSPLSRSQQFQINDYLNDSVRMRNLYPQSVVDLNDPRIVERLRQVGIPGIKYLDEGSRGAEASKQTRNFVTFPGEEQNLRILERNSQKASDLLASPIDEEELRRRQSGLLYAP